MAMGRESCATMEDSGAWETLMSAHEFDGPSYEHGGRSFSKSTIPIAPLSLFGQKPPLADGGYSDESGAKIHAA